MAPKKEKSNSSDPDSMQLRQFEFWEGLRRHPEYKALCEGIKFLPNGTIEPEWAAVAENQQLIEKRRRRIKENFRVEGIMDPDRSYVELPPGVVGEVARESVAEGGRALRIGELLWEGRYLTLTVDVTLPWDETKKMVKEYIRLQRAMAEVKLIRTRFEEAKEAFQVYDLRVAGITDTEIVKKLWPAEFKAATVNDEAARQKKYVVKSREYKAAGVKDYDDRAFKEAFRGAGFLYQRVADRDLSAKKRIEGMTQK
jgi:hypothetical protein